MNYSLGKLSQDVATTLDGLTGVSTVPSLGLLLPGLDLALNQVLIGLDVLLAGVLNLVATLYVPSLLCILPSAYRTIG